MNINDNTVEYKYKNDLKRDIFAEKLAESIINYSNMKSSKFESSVTENKSNESEQETSESNSLTIGLNGVWGSGKTSFMELILLFIKKKDINDEFIIIRFNPWFFSNKKNLYLQFFKTIINELKNKEAEPENIIERTNNPHQNGVNIFKKSEIEELEDYSNYIQFNLDESQKIYNSNRYISEAYDSLSFYKEKCDECFKEKKYKVIIVIDDIDRLVNDEINQIFTLVKSLANFNNFIYLLCFDKKIVSKSLNEFHSDQAEKFIDKIIQIPIVIPKVNESILDEIIQKELNKFYSKNYESIDKNYSYDLIEVSNFLNLFINDISDLNRFSNLLYFYKDRCTDELNINDFILMLAIQLFDYNLFLKIKKHKNLLTYNETLSKVKTNVINKEEELKAFQSSLSKNLKEVLSYLFPILKDNSTNNEVKNPKYRVHNYDYFDRYFELALEKKEVNPEMLEKLIKMNKIGDICNILIQSNDTEYNHSLIYHFSKNIENVPVDNCQQFINTINKYKNEMNLNEESERRLNFILIQLSKKVEVNKEFC